MPPFFPIGYGGGNNFGASSFRPIQPSFGFPDQYGSSVVGSMGGYGSGATPPFNDDEQGKALWQQLIAAYENAEKQKKWAQLDAAGEQIGTALSNGISGSARPTYAAARNDLAMGASGVDDATSILKAYMAMKGQQDQEAQQAAAIQAQQAEQTYKQNALAQDESQFSRTQERMSKEAEALRAYNEAKDAQEAAYRDQALAVDKSQAATQRMAAQAAIENNKLSREAQAADKADKRQAAVQSEVHSLSQSPQLQSAQDFYSAFDNADRIANTNKNLPGVGPFGGQVPDRFVGKEGMEFRTAIRNMQVQFNHAISGASMSPKEAERLKEANSLIETGSEENIRVGMASLKSLYDQKFNTALSGVSPEAQQQFSAANPGLSKHMPGGETDEEKRKKQGFVPRTFKPIGR